MIEYGLDCDLEGVAIEGSVFDSGTERLSETATRKPASWFTHVDWSSLPTQTDDLWVDFIQRVANSVNFEIEVTSDLAAH